MGVGLPGYAGESVGGAAIGGMVAPPTSRSLTLPVVNGGNTLDMFSCGKCHPPPTSNLTAGQARGWVWTCRKPQYSPGCRQVYNMGLSGLRQTGDTSPEVSPVAAFKRTGPVNSVCDPAC